MIVLTDSKAHPDEEYEALVEQGKLLESKIDLPVGHLSVSQVNMHSRCARAYCFRYCDGIIGPPKAVMAEGKAVHRALEVGQREKQKSKTLAPLSVLMDAHNDAWKIESAEVKTYDEDAPEKIILKRDRIFLSEYHKRFMPYQNPLGIEKRFWLSVGSLNIPVLGYIDLIVENNKPPNAHEPAMPQEEVVDYKVTGKTISQNETDSSLQLTTYAHATGLSHVGFDMFVKTKTPKVKTVRSIRSAREWAWTAKHYEDVARSIATGIFPPGDVSGWWCSRAWCYYWDRCRGK